MLDQAGVRATDYYVKNEHGDIVHLNLEVGLRQIFLLIPKRSDYIHVFHDGTSFLCFWKPDKTIKQMLDDNGLFKETAIIEDQNAAIVDVNQLVGVRRHFSIIDH
ncbi:uncharacterized protein LOC117115236 [Anneissia japonica]|uniref:uncharacterized protein LOC117115236 n=1 Tax=Anneissia japonica TaxID=1529436 RepID=UPI001425645B|nr:uncharacterized protein LOC117115236 [Anneissia japonica]